jgi:hypothetical protein
MLQAQANAAAPPGSEVAAVDYSEEKALMALYMAMRKQQVGRARFCVCHHMFLCCFPCFLIANLGVAVAAAAAAAAAVLPSADAPTPPLVALPL